MLKYFEKYIYICNSLIAYLKINEYSQVSIRYVDPAKLLRVKETCMFLKR